MITLAELKEYLYIQDNANDEFLLKLIDMSTARINNLCGRELNFGSRTDILDGNSENVIYLFGYPVQEVIYIKYRETNQGFTHDLFEGGSLADNIYLVNKTGKLILLNGFNLPEGISNVEIKYYAGYYDSSPIPECETPKDLKCVCMMMSAELFLKSFRSFDSEYGARLGLERYEHGTDEGTNSSRRAFTYRDEDFMPILRKYRALRL
ncbi:MAG: phage gp6-like head-tail connector protein [Ignavibacteriae bacterium]|nr:phage gp6-like head-tail connector protein [Ignavibacteriota bacterium]